MQTPLPSAGTQGGSGTAADLYMSPAPWKLSSSIGVPSSFDRGPLLDTTASRRSNCGGTARGRLVNRFVGRAWSSTATASDKLGSQSIPCVTRIGLVGFDGEAPGLDELLHRAGVERERGLDTRSRNRHQVAVGGEHAPDRSAARTEERVQPMLACGVSAAAT